MRIDKPDLLADAISKADQLQRKLDAMSTPEGIAKRKADDEAYRRACELADALDKNKPTRSDTSVLTTDAEQFSEVVDHDFAFAERRLKRKLAATPTSPEQRAALQAQLDALHAGRKVSRAMTMKELIEATQKARYSLARARQRGDKAAEKAAQARLLALHREKRTRGSIRVAPDID